MDSTRKTRRPAFAPPPPGASVDDKADLSIHWTQWFKASPTPLWLEDFSAVAREFGRLSGEGVPDVARWLRKHPEETLALASLVVVLDANQAAADLIQAEDISELLDSITVGFEDESYPSFLEELIKIARGNRRFSVDIVARTLKGERRYLRMQWTAAPGHEEDLALVYVSAVDLTELIATEDRLRNALKVKDFLLREIQHRMRNTLTLINSMIEMQAERTPGAMGALLESARRVETLAVVHESLYRRGDPSLTDLRDCVEGSARQVYGREADPASIDLRTEADELELRVESAAPLALITGELVSNAIRHGSAGRAKATVRVRARRDGTGLVLSVGDEGQGFELDSATSPRAGLGLSLVRALAQQLDARLSVDRTNGCTVTLEIPGNL